MLAATEINKKSFICFCFRTLKYAAKSRDRESVLSVAMLGGFASRDGHPYFVEIALEKFGHNLQFAHSKVHRKSHIFDRCFLYDLKHLFVKIAKTFLAILAFYHS